MIHPSVGIAGTVEAFIPSGAWHFASSPIQTAYSGVFTGNYLIEWSEADSTWTFIEPTNVPLNTGQGYGVWADVNDVAEFKGALNYNDISPTLTFNDNAGEGHGWNMIGNPYPSALNWNTNWTDSNIDHTIYLYDASAGNYKTWNRNTSSGTASNGDIPVGQGFWVKANAASPSVTIPNTERVHSNQDFYKNLDVVIEEQLTLTVEGETYSDAMLLQFHNNATTEFDSDFDAYKITGTNEAPHLYSVQNGNKYMVNANPALSGTTNQKYHSIPVGFQALPNQVYTLSIDGMKSLPAFITVILEDMKENVVYNLDNTNQIKITYSENDPEIRFMLHFVFTQNDPYKEDRQSFIERSLLNNVFAYGQKVYVATEQQDAIIQISNLSGQIVYSEKSNNQILQIIEPKVESGLYVVSVIGNQHKSTLRSGLIRKSFLT